MEIIPKTFFYGKSIDTRRAVGSSPERIESTRDNTDSPKDEQRRIRVLRGQKTPRKNEWDDLQFWKEQGMKETTKKRYRRIREEFNKLAGKMPLLQIYIVLGEFFGLSDETIRQILHKKHPP